jgi:hypothetical protein
MDFAAEGICLKDHSRGLSRHGSWYRLRDQHVVDSLRLESCVHQLL